MHNRGIEHEDRELNIIITSNLKKLMDFHGLNYTTVCEYLLSKGENTVDRTTISKLINHPRDHKISLQLLRCCCRSFHVTFEQLCSAAFDPYQNIELSSDSPKDEEIFSEEMEGSGIFVENPASPIIKKYLQKYYCYYLSTVSSENKTKQPEDAILKGWLNLEADETKCRATLSINTKTQDECGEPNYKVYTGKAVFCTSIQAVNCLLCNKDGEFCFMIFRYSHLNFKKQECRVAEVLSTSSALDKRCPVVHRMILCKEDIKDKDIGYLIPHLQFNSSQIMISEPGLASLARGEYRDAVNEIMKRDKETMCLIDEKDVIEIAEKNIDPSNISRFMSDLRLYAFAHRYNKVGRTVDSMVWELLKELGYFSN